MKTIEERARKWVDSQGAGSVHPYNRQAMPVLINAVVRDGRNIVKGGMCILDAVATDSVKYADALIAELDKTNNNEK